MLARPLLLALSLCGAPSHAGMDDPDHAQALLAAGEIVDMVDKKGLKKEELAEVGKRYAELGFTPEDLERAPRETQARMESVDKGIAALQQLSRDLDQASDSSATAEVGRLLKEREALRLRLSKDHDDLTELQKTLRAIWKRSEYIVMAGILTRKASAAELLDMERKKDFHKKVTQYYEKAREALERDAAAHKERQERAARRKAVRNGAVLGALLLALLAAAVATWRRSRRPLSLLSDTVPVDVERGSLLAGMYRVDREVGRGAMGVVYEGLDMALKRKVALKRMRDELRNNPRELQLLLAEAQTVAALKHPNIVEIFNVLQDRGEVYLVFEFVEGAVLSAVVTERQRLTAAQTVGVAAQVAAAMDFAHERKVIHRDLKPANIMVTREGRAKVMDFGIAHQAQKTVARLTRAQSWGTPAYMAPEQELGQVSKAADIYSLTACCYEMLTGVLPFQGPNFLAQKQQLVLRDPSALVAGLPKTVDAVMRRGLAAAPQNRFVTASALVSALQGALGASPP